MPDLSLLNIHSQIEAKSRDKEEALQKFERALIDGNPRAVAKCLPMIDDNFCWRGAMRRVAQIKQDLNPLLRYRLHAVWTHHGDHIRQETADDLLLADALRKLLPPYAGGGKTLYRGETFENWKHRTYGLSWTPLKNIAVGFCVEGFHRYAKGGTVLLKAAVPQEAIIARIHKGYDYYQEQEYVVDRRGLKPNSVSAVKYYRQIAAQHAA